MTDTIQSAGLLRRLGAISYDALVLGAVLIAATAITLPFNDGEAVAAGTLWYQAYLAAIVLVYFCGSWWKRGQTIGMVAWRIRLHNRDGGPLRLWQVLIRAVTAIASLSPLGLGFFWALFDRQKRTWHDLASGTRLVTLT